MASNPSFDPDTFFSQWDDKLFVPSPENGASFKDCIIKAFNLPTDDSFVYQAHGVTTLELTQKAINGKRAHGLHGWYHDEEEKPINPPHPTPKEISSYTTLFHPPPNPLKALKSLTASTSQSTCPLLSLSSTHLLSNFHPPPPSLSPLPPHTPTRQHTNPYLSLWTYSCHELEYAGPIPSTARTKISHHILPIFYHHFGCTPPSFAALYVIAKLAQPGKPSKEPVRRILDVGCGSGYWTYMLRRFVGEQREREGGKGVGAWKELVVHGVDNGDSEYRVNWIGDTIHQDAVEFLGKGRIGEWAVDGGSGCVLLLVYPQTTGGFTEGVLRAFRGDTVVVVGTQNGNGFTGFKEEMVDRWVEREMKEWGLMLRMPLPSFAGKDEALYVFQRKETSA